jgi:hypothetical protein
MYAYFRNRPYVRSLVDSPGNRSLKRKHRFFFAGAIASLLIAGWYVTKLWRVN